MSCIVLLYAISLSLLERSLFIAHKNVSLKHHQQSVAVKRRGKGNFKGMTYLCHTKLVLNSLPQPDSADGQEPLLEDGREEVTMNREVKVWEPINPLKALCGIVHPLFPQKNLSESEILLGQSLEFFTHSIASFCCCFPLFVEPKR